MVALTDSIKIKATQEKIFNALIKIFSTEKYYKMWHKDHTICKWLKGKPFEKGSILYAEEYLHGKLHKMKFIGANLVRNKKVEFKLMFPTSIFCPKGSFIIEQGKERRTFFILDTLCVTDELEIRSSIHFTLITMRVISSYCSASPTNLRTSSIMRFAISFDPLSANDGIISESLFMPYSFSSLFLAS